MKKSLSLFIPLMIFSAGCFAASSDFVVLNADNLSYSAEKIKEKNSKYLLAYNELMRRANDALNSRLYSVMDKKLVGASSDKHDYYSLPPYWWPDKNKVNGVPYIKKDGVINPDSNNDATDKLRMNKFGKDVYHLALAYYFTNEIKFAEKARLMLVTWFIDQKTKMNPNMEYAQAIPGINTGRGIGLIDSRVLVDVIDAIELIRPSNLISDEEYVAIKDWYKKFYNWMTQSKNGFEEDNWHNNHGSYYDMQAAAYALFSGMNEEVKKRLTITQLRRIASHFDREGRQNAELERTRPWHYSNFNLEAYTKLGMIGEKVNVNIWSFALDEHSLTKGYKYIANFIDTKNKWQYKDIDGTIDEEKALINMLSAARAYPEELFSVKANYLIRKYPKNIDLLVYPIKEKVKTIN